MGSRADREVVNQEGLEGCQAGRGAGSLKVLVRTETRSLGEMALREAAVGGEVWALGGCGWCLGGGHAECAGDAFISVTFVGGVRG